MFFGGQHYNLYCFELVNYIKYMFYNLFIFTFLIFTSERSISQS